MEWMNNPTHRKMLTADQLIVSVTAIKTNPHNWGGNDMPDVSRVLSSLKVSSNLGYPLPIWISSV